MSNRTASSMEQLRHELLSDLAAHITQVLLDHGVEQDVADQAGIASADFLADHWGGQLISIPMDHKFRVASRDLQIWREFRGNNHAELARRYGMTLRGIYKVIARVKARETERTQPSLI